MSWGEHVRGSYFYNEWANGRLLDAAAKLSDEQLVNERGGSRGSVADNLEHLVDTQIGWSAVISEKGRSLPWERPAEGIAAALRARFDESDAWLREITGGLTDESLAAVVRTLHGGEMHGFPRWQMLLHLVNHGTQHRAEIGLALLALDASPGDLDAIGFFPDLGAEG